MSLDRAPAFLGDANLVEELLGPLLEQLLLNSLLRHCVVLIASTRSKTSESTYLLLLDLVCVVRVLEDDALPFLHLVETQRALVLHLHVLAIQHDVQLLVVGRYLEMAVDHRFELGHEALLVDVQLQALSHAEFEMTQVLNFYLHFICL